MADFALRNNLAGPGFALTLALTAALPPATTKPAVFTDIYYSYVDDPNMEPIYLGRGNKGETFQAQDITNGRAVRFYFNPVPSDKEQGFADFSKMATAEFDPTSGPDFETILAGEDIPPNNLVNIYNDGGTPKARKANATDNTKPCHGFAKDNILSGASGRIYFRGASDRRTGLTAGLYYLSTTAGGITQTAPTGSGNIQQAVGVASSATDLQFEPQPFIEIA